MIPQIGDDVILSGKIVHVQDRDCIQKIARVGIPDENGIVWGAIWVSWDDITSYNFNAQSNQRD